MILQTGGRSLGATSTRSMPASRAVSMALPVGMTPSMPLGVDHPDGRDADLLVDPKPTSSCGWVRSKREMASFSSGGKGIGNLGLNAHNGQFPGKAGRLVADLARADRRAADVFRCAREASHQKLVRTSNEVKHGDARLSKSPCDLSLRGRRGQGVQAGTQTYHEWRMKPRVRGGRQSLPSRIKNSADLGTSHSGISAFNIASPNSRKIEPRSSEPSGSDPDRGSASPISSSARLASLSASAHRFSNCA